MKKKFISVALDSELFTMLEKLKEAKKNSNSSQIVREALWLLAEKILPENVHICTNMAKSGCGVTQAGGHKGTRQVAPRAGVADSC